MTSDNLRFRIHIYSWYTHQQATNRHACDTSYHVCNSYPCRERNIYQGLQIARWDWLYLQVFCLLDIPGRNNWACIRIRIVYNSVEEAFHHQ